MNRYEEIHNAALECSRDTEICHQWSFIKGAEWADEHPNGISMSYLQSWYQDSIDETKEPTWTDKHLEELFNDFYLIPKKKKEE